MNRHEKQVVCPQSLYLLVKHNTAPLIFNKKETRKTLQSICSNGLLLKGVSLGEILFCISTSLSFLVICLCVITVMYVSIFRQGLSKIS